MKRRFVVAGVILAVVGAVVFVAVQRQRGSVALESAPGPVVHEKSAVTTSVVPTPTVFTPGLASVVDRSLPSDERVHGLTSGKVTEIKDGRDLETLAQLLGDPAENDTVRHEIASLLARSGYPALDACLVKVLENPAEKSRFRAWAVQHLGKVLASSRPGEAATALTERIRALLTDRHIEVRRQALQALVKRGDAKTLEQVVTWLKTEGPEGDAMRDLAIHCAQENDLRDQIPTIRLYSRSTNDIIRIAALVALSQWGDEESRPAIEEAASSPVVRIQRCGQAALKRLDAAKATPGSAPSALPQKGSVPRI